MREIPFDRVIEVSDYVISHQFFSHPVPEGKIDRTANQVLETVIDQDQYFPAPLDADRMYQLSRTIIMMHNEDLEEKDRVAGLLIHQGEIVIESITNKPSRNYE